MLKRLLLGFILIAVPHVAAVNASFAAPAQWNGDVTVDRLEWAVLVIAPDQHAAGQMQTTGDTTIVRHSAAKPVLRSEAIGMAVPVPLPSEPEQVVQAFDANLTFEAPVWKSLVIRGNNLRLILQQGAGSIDVIGTNDNLESGLDDRQYPDGTLRPTLGTVPKDSVVWSSRPHSTLAWTLQADGPMQLEFLNGTIACGRGDCPSSADPQESKGAAGASFTVLEYLDLGTAGRLSLQGAAWAIAAGAPSIDALAQGQFRMPGLSLAPSCTSAGCIAADGETLRSDGMVQFQNLSWNGGQDRRINGLFESKAGTVTLDEQPIDGRLLGQTVSAVAVAAATAGTIGLLVRFIGPLFTRIREHQAIEHPKRRILLDAITSNPGMSFSNLLRVTGLGAGTARHHLNILATLGLIQTKTLGTSARYYPRGLGQAQWIGMAVLQSGHSRDICGAIGDKPGITQVELLARMAGKIPRSSVQFKLRQLAESEVIRATRLGKKMVYAPGRFFPGHIEAGLTVSTPAA